MFKQFLGDSEKKVIKLLQNYENILISGISGIGLSTFVRAILEKLTNKNTICIHLFGYEIENLLTANELYNYLTKVVKTSMGFDVSTFDDIFLSTNLNVVIAVDELDKLNNKDILTQLLNQLRQKFFYRLTVIYSVSLKYFNSDITLKGFHRLIFKGFVEKNDVLIESFCTYYNIKKLNNQQIKKVFNLAYNHTGLIKAVMIYYKINNKIPTVKLLFKDNYDIKDRCKKILNDFTLDGIQIESYKTANQVNPYLEKVGLSINNKICPIFKYYLDNYELKNIKSSLTKTEEQIYNYLNKTEYKSIDELVDFLNENKNNFEITNWTVYKHINNLNKKLKVKNEKIVNIRNKGYKIQIIIRDTP